MSPVTQYARTDAGASQRERDYAQLHGALAANRTEHAWELCCSLLACEPESVELLLLAGSLAFLRGGAAQAVGFLGRAAALNPGLPETHNNLGVALQELGRYPEAAACYREALRLRPVYREASCNLANTLRSLGEDDQALECYRAAIAADPDHPDAHYNLANALRAADRLPEAVECYRRLLAAAPRHLPGWLNLAGSLLALNRYQEALEAGRRALELDPQSADAHFCRALALLAQGEYRAGWREYEWRLKDAANFPASCAGRPLWDGSPLAGRTLLLRCEQGFGDALQFYRYAVMLARGGARVVLECRPELLRLFSSQGEPLELVAAGGEPPPFDVFCYLMSLPFLCGTTLDTVPAQIPYLRGDAALTARWRGRLRGDGGIKVGVAWAGSSGYRNDRDRSLPCALLAQLSRVPGLELFSLQVGESARELARVPALAGVRDLAPELRDFAETAAVIECLDLVVTVDTAVAHLAGALGKRVCLLLPAAGEWRWLSGRDDSPWYPSARLYRQERAGDWQALLDRVAHDLLLELEDLNCQFRRANGLRSAGHTGEVAAAYRWLLGRWPSCAEVHNNLGLALQDEGRLDEAEQCYREALRLRPDLADAWNNLGTALVSRDDREAASLCFKEALALRDDYLPAYVNLGSALQNLERPAEALPLYLRAIELEPRALQARVNLGTAYQDLWQPEQAVRVYEEALVLAPCSAELHWNLALSLLGLGDFQRGWQEYEWRFRRDRAPVFQGTPWEGEELAGQSILLWCEQGLGDSLLFVRYAQKVAARGGRVLLRCQSASLKPVLARVPGVAAVFGPEEPLPPFQWHAPLLSLPRILGATFDGVEVPYLFPDPERLAAWRLRLRPGAFKVGLVWKVGAPPRNRSCPYTEFAPLAGIPGIDFYSLQLGEAPLSEVLPATDLSGALGDFADSAAVMANLDLVISVDTAGAHLAGGLGVPVWTLLPSNSDWRWFAGTDSPWYPSMRLFRQSSPGDWRGVMRAVAARLQRLPAKVC